MIVIDPRRTETAQMADLHLQLKPGSDAFLMAAILAVIMRENREAREFIESRTTGFEAVKETLLIVDVEAYARRAVNTVDDVYKVARLISTAGS